MSQIGREALWIVTDQVTAVSIKELGRGRAKDIKEIGLLYF